MKKQLQMTFCWMLSLILLASCHSSRTMRLDLKGQKQGEKLKFEEVFDAFTDISQKTFTKELEAGEIGTYIVFGDKLYYSVDFVEYLINDKGQNYVAIIPFEEKYNTQIWEFDFKTKEDRKLYTYHADHAIRVSSIRCNGEDLVWMEEVRSEKGGAWTVKHLNLKDKGEPKDIFDSETQKGKLNKIFMTLSQEKLYWYNIPAYEEDEKNPIALFSYHLKTKEIKKEKEKLKLQTPYVSPSLFGDFQANFAQKDEDTWSLYLDDIGKGQSLELELLGKINNPKYNGRYCIWDEGFDSSINKRISIYNNETKQLNYIEILDDLFSHQLLGNYIIFNTGEGLYAYDIEKQVYQTITTDDTYYLLKGSDGRLCFRKLTPIGEKKRIDHVILVLQEGK